MRTFICSRHDVTYHSRSTGCPGCADAEMYEHARATAVETEVRAARFLADRKHGERSIEHLGAHDTAWLPVLVEEVGEVARAKTYDGASNLRDELIDVMAVASAWVDAIDRHRSLVTEAEDRP